MSWRVALIDSCGTWPGAVDAAAFVDESGRLVQRRATGVDATGHGSRVVRVLSEGGAEFELMLGQVFLGKAPASAAAVRGARGGGVACRRGGVCCGGGGTGAGRRGLSGGLSRGDSRDGGCSLWAGGAVLLGAWAFWRVPAVGGEWGGEWRDRCEWWCWCRRGREHGCWRRCGCRRWGQRRCSMGHARYFERADKAGCSRGDWSLGEEGELLGAGAERPRLGCHRNR
jgi:hypothetical protein